MKMSKLSPFSSLSVVALDYKSNLFDGKIYDKQHYHNRMKEYMIAKDEKENKAINLINQYMKLRELQQNKLHYALLQVEIQFGSISALYLSVFAKPTRKSSTIQDILHFHPWQILRLLDCFINF